MHKKIHIDTLKVRAKVLDEAFKSKDWNGENSTAYFRRKSTKQKIENILKEIIHDHIEKIDFQDSCKECNIYINSDVDHWQTLSDIYQKGLNAHYVGYSYK